MDDMYRRMAYRQAARATFYQSEQQKEKGKTNQSAQAPVFYAHGFAVHSQNQTTGEERWNGDSAFGEVFFDFEKAKQYVLSRFWQLLKQIYAADALFADCAPDYGDMEKCDEAWKREYIEEYVFYDLVVTQIFPERVQDIAKDFTAPQKIDWHFRYNGEMCTRYYIFDKEKFECRENDLQDSAGTKFHVGDLVECSDWEDSDNRHSVFVVLSVPQKPTDKTTPWENRYELIGIENNMRLKNYGFVQHQSMHEGDLRLCADDNLNNNFFREPLLALQKAVRGEISEELREKILRGNVLFNASPSWRDFAELKTKS